MTTRPRREIDVAGRSKWDFGMEGRSKASRAVIGGAFGAGMAVLTGSTPIGIAMVAALGAGLAAKFGGRKEGERGDRDG